MANLRIKHIGDGAGRDGAAMVSIQARRTIMCRKCGLEKRFIGSSGGICGDCAPPKKAYTMPPPGPPKPSRKGTARGRHIGPERAQQIASIRGDHELRGMSCSEIAAARDMTYKKVYEIINYHFAARIDPL